MINLTIPATDTHLKPRITVIGVGGAGGNAVNNMIRANLEGVEFIACNTDAQALHGCLADRKLQLGVNITQGLGAGSRPDVGRAAAEEAMDEIMAGLEGSHMVFITAGMGGGTGTGAAPVIARAAREQGILTVGVVTKPFHFEGAMRMKLAETGLAELQQYVDTLIIIPNQNLFRIANEKTTFADAFKMADDVLHSGVRGVTDLMVMPGLINLDFADIRTIMAEMGKAMMGTGESDGDRRAVLAAESAISNPLLDDVSMKGARGVLINITGGLDMTLYEVDEAANRIRDEVDPDANIIFGAIFDESLEGRVRVSVVATGIDCELSEGQRPGPLPGLTVVGGRSVGAPSASPAAATAFAAEGGDPGGVPAATTASAEPAVETVSGLAETAALGEAPRLAANGGPAYGMVAVEAPSPAAPAMPAAAVAAAPVQAPEPVPAPAPMPAPPAAVPAPAGGPPRAERQEGRFIPPRPVETRAQPAVAQPGAAMADPFAEAEIDNAARSGDRRRANSIFRRMTGLLRDEEDGSAEAGRTGAPTMTAAPPAAQMEAAPRPAMGGAPARPAAAGTAAGTAPARPAAPPAPAVQQPRLDIAARPPLPRHEDDDLEIPAFLRRQAN